MLQKGWYFPLGAIAEGFFGEGKLFEDCVLDTFEVTSKSVSTRVNICSGGLGVRGCTAFQRARSELQDLEPNQGEG